MAERRLAIVTSRPIQYQAPLWRALAAVPGLSVRVLYATDRGAEWYFDAAFGRRIQWDVPLLDGYDWKVLPNRPLRGLGWRFELRCPSIGRELERGGYDAVLLVGKEHWYYLQAIRAALHQGIPILYRAETPPPRRGRMQAEMAGWQRRRLFPRFASLLCVGREQRAFYRGYGVPDSRMFWAPYCVDNRFFQEAARRFGPERDRIRARWGFGRETRVVAFAAKFIDRKRPRDLIDAFARLPRDGRYGLLMAGSGPRLEACRAHAAACGLRNVAFPGFLNQSEIGAVYAAADCFVLPSEHETWGLVVNEAMNFALPVVVSDGVGAGRDLVEEGANGHRYPTGDVEALARALRAVLASEVRRAALGRRSRAIVDGYSVARSVAGIVAALEAATHRARGCRFEPLAAGAATGRP